MHPAFRSTGAALGFCLLLTTLLTLPVLLSWVGLPDRQQSYKSLATTAGPTAEVLKAIYQGPAREDIIFLGSSLVIAGVDRERIQSALASHLHRPANVQVLALNWAGLDLQYFLLRDYLAQHKVTLLVWNLPQPESRAYDAPHIQSYRWVRFGEYSDALQGLPLPYRLALYGEMLVGAPRQLLALLRPNLAGNEGAEIDALLARQGYNGAPFVPDAMPVSAAAESRSRAARLLPLDSPLLSNQGRLPGPYQMHFAARILELARLHHCSTVLLHIPVDGEYGKHELPELAPWSRLLNGQLEMIGVPSAELFAEADKSRVMHFYRDAHLNENGQLAFTNAITEAVIAAYDGASRADQK